MKTLKKLALLTVMFSLTALGLGACNTVEGAGKDIKAAGEGIEDAADGD